MISKGFAAWWAARPQWLRRVLKTVVGVVAFVGVLTVTYHTVMIRFEGASPTLAHSLQVVVETVTGTGYGSDAPWNTTEMRLFVIVMDITGVVMIFLALPVLLFPLFEEAMETKAPSTVENGLSDHVVICQFSPRGETLVTELDTWDVDYVIVEPDRTRANDLYEDGYYVIHADPQSVDGLERAHLSSARALVADASDQVNTSIILTAREVDESVRTVSVVKEPDRAKYHDLAGADAVLSPRGLLGESLASKAATAVRTRMPTTTSRNLGDRPFEGRITLISFLPTFAPSARSRAKYNERLKHRAASSVSSTP